MYFKKPSKLPRGTSACDKPVVEPGGFSVAVLPFDVTICRVPPLRAGLYRPTVGNLAVSAGARPRATRPLEIGRFVLRFGVSLSSSREPVAPSTSHALAALTAQCKT